MLQERVCKLLVPIMQALRIGVHSIPSTDGFVGCPEETSFCPVFAINLRSPFQHSLVGCLNAILDRRLGLVEDTGFKFILEFPATGANGFLKGLVEQRHQRVIPQKRKYRGVDATREDKESNKRYDTMQMTDGITKLQNNSQDQG